MLRLPSWIRIFQLFQFSFGMLLWLPIFFEVQKRVGLDEAEIFKIQTIYYLVFCAFELPTGMLADRIGYRAALCLGGVVGAVANVLPALAPHFQGFLWHFVWIALCRSLVSGAASAYLFERLEQEGARALYQREEGRARALSLLGKVIGWSAVGFWVDHSPFLAYWASAGFLLLSAGLAGCLPRLRPRVISESGTEERITARRSFSERVLALLPPGGLLTVLSQGVGLFVLGRIVQVNLYQPILKAHSVPVFAFGVLMSAMTLVEAVGSWYPDRLPGFLASRDSFGRVTRITLATAALLPVLVLPMDLPLELRRSFSVGALLIFAWLMGVGYPIQKRVVNEAIASGKSRASFLSLESLLDRGVNAAVAALLGATVTSDPRTVSGVLWGLSLAFFVFNGLIHGLQRRGERLRSA
jgi:MFS family permease